MTVTLWVNWKEKEILTVEEYIRRVEARTQEKLTDKEDYEEYLEEYLDCNYTTTELFDLLASEDFCAIQEEVKAIKEGVEDLIRDYVEESIYSDFNMVYIEV